MTTQTEALTLALEALENTTPTGFNMETDKRFYAAIKAIKEALAQPEQEPVIGKQKTFEASEFQLELDAGFAAQEYCRSLWGAARGHGDWRKFHDAFVAGYKAAPHQPQRKPLTDEQIADILPDDDTPISLGEAFVKFARAVEAAHGIKE